MHHQGKKKGTLVLRQIIIKFCRHAVITFTAPSLTQEKFDAAKESYFNSIDRFASLVLNGQFPENELKQDYHDLLKEIIRAYQADFSAGTRYRKILRLYNKWEDGK